MKLLARIYPALALGASAFFLTPSFSFVAILPLLFYIYLRFPKSAPVLWLRLSVLTDFFIFFALAALFQPQLGLLSVLVAIPVLGAISVSLEEASRFSPPSINSQQRRMSNVSLTLFSTTVLILFLSLLLGSQALALATAACLVYLAALTIAALRGMPVQPIKAEKVKLRLVAGTKGEAQVKVTPLNGLVGRIFLRSPHSWIKVEPDTLCFDRSNKTTSIKLSLTPPLSGPSEPELMGQAVDRWGLLEFSFESRPMRLYVIPRARYAAWLARKYLLGTGTGTLPLLSTTGTFRSATATRTGIEYYGSRPYEPGDSLKMIDWKHSVKLNELVSKEFNELKGQPALQLINLVATDTEEADKLAYNIIATALSFARENIPSTLAVYDHERVRLTTDTLPPRAVITKALEIAEQMVSFASPLRFLAPPDIAGLRTNLHRLRQVNTGPATALTRLMELEYKNLDLAARESPVTAALLEGLKKAHRSSNLVVISERNHDVEALAFNLFWVKRRGYAVIEV